MTDRDIDKRWGAEPEIKEYLRSARDRVRNTVIGSSGIMRKFDDTVFVPNIFHHAAAARARSAKSARYSPAEIHRRFQALLAPLSVKIAYVGGDDAEKVGYLAHYFDATALCMYDRYDPVRLSTEPRACVDALLAKLGDGLRECVVPPGYMCGIVSAQSLGEPLTQFTLDTFHQTGHSDSISSMDGIQRILELLNLSKNQKTPVTRIHLLPEFQRERAFADFLSRELAYVCVENVVEHLQIVWDRTAARAVEDGLCVDPAYLVGLAAEGRGLTDWASTPWVFRMVIDKEKCMGHNLDLTTIKVAVYDTLIKCRDTKSAAKKYWASDTCFCLLSNSIHDDVWVVHLRMKFPDSVTVEHLLSWYSSLVETSYIKGVPHIEACAVMEYPRFVVDADTGGIREDHEFAVVLQGTNILPVFDFYGVDPNRCVTNDPQLTYELYGVEAARDLLFEEIRKTYEQGGISLNAQHFSLLGDIMTRNGTMISINRYGLNKLDSDPLSKASFEQTMSELLTAAVHQEDDHIRSVSSRIMCGRTVRGGTGIVTVIPDVSMCEGACARMSEETAARPFAFDSELAALLS
jgi:DNA-directed RNA polymerase II subunit RPB1